MQKENKKHIGELLRKIRKEKGLSQMELAERLDISYQQIQKYEKGISNLSASRLMEIAKALGVSIRAFFPSENMIVSDEEKAYRTMTNEEMVLLDFFRKIKDKEVKKALIEFIKILSKK